MSSLKELVGKKTFLSWLIGLVWEVLNAKLGLGVTPIVGGATLPVVMGLRTIGKEAK